MVDHQAVDDSAARDIWKTVKGGAVTAFTVKFAPIIAASLGFPPAIVVTIAAAVGHGLLSLLSRKTGWTWL